jgi:hypothetical protein
MDVVSTCPLRVASLVWQPRAGAFTLTVVVKATFRLAPEVCPLADEQDDPFEADDHWDDDEARSLRAASDLAPRKARPEVLLVGHAFAPGGEPVRSLIARLAVAGIDKRLVAFCDRVFWQDGRLLEGQPFAKMPLRHERAAGGPSTANPVGVRFDAPPDAYGAVRVANLQPPGVVVARRGDRFAPIAFAPLAPGWPGRVEKLGRHAASWSPRALGERPLPDDLDPAYFNAAPPDQQVEAIEADARLVLENLHPDHPLLETSLPGIHPVALMTAGDRAGEEIALEADTLWIDTDRGVAALTWRGRVALSHPAEAGRITVSMEDPSAASTQPGQAQRMETVLGGRAGGPALPFGPGKSPWAGHRPAPAVIRAPLPATPTGTLTGVRSPMREALPFAPPIAPLDLAPVAEPDAIGPLAAPPAEEPAAELDPETPPLGSPEPAALEPAAPAPEPEDPATDAELPLDEFPIERCAAIAASIARTPAREASILDAIELHPALWARIEQRWSEAITGELSRGKMGLVNAYDAAYVGRLEEERGPITIAEHARLVVAAERGRAAEVLAELTLPAGTLVRLERILLKKIVADPLFGASVRRAVKAAREAG